MQRSEEALGVSALADITSRSRSTTTTLVGQGVQMSGVSYWLGPDQIYMKESFPGMGDIESGYDGEVAWSRDPILGLRELSGPELAQLKQATLGVEADYTTFFTQRRYLGMVEEEGRTFLKLEMTPEGGEAITSFIDAESYLLVKQETVVISPQGRVPVVAMVGDYQGVDGYQIPFMVTSTMGPITMEQAVTDVSHNIEVDPSIFKMPAQ